MIRNTVANTVNYFYPLGNTPPVSLTQDLPPEINADILLLGCGDARNILFTCFTDPDRKFDITCCDIEPAILARNILLYTLLVDNTVSKEVDQIWNIYYHWKIDNRSLQLLDEQLEKLLFLSQTLQEWHQSVYGASFRFCNESTISKVREFWTSCASNKLTTAEKLDRHKSFQRNIEKARKLRETILGNGTSIAGVRSAAPTGIQGIQDFANVETAWWNAGTIGSRKKEDNDSVEFNPMFFASWNQSLTLHYGIHPLLGFPLATAYVPLVSNNGLYVEKGSMSSSEYLCECARQHFRAWTSAFNNTISNGSTIRFCASDGLALSITLKNAMFQKDDELLSANIFTDNWSSEKLVLDRNEYEYPNHQAPRRFNVIDTSNLIDHLGALNLLPVSAALLKKETYSTVYTESLVQTYSNEKERVAQILGAEVRSVALMLGLSPCEIWTNATTSPEDESVLNAFETYKRINVRGSTQIRSRLRWKQTFSLSDAEKAPIVFVEPLQAAKFLVKLYDHMFQNENISFQFQHLTTNQIAQRSNPCYNRASFVFLLKHIQNTMQTNWDKCLDEMMSTIFAGFSDAPIGANFAQELISYMHMLEIETNRLPVLDLVKNKDAEMGPFFDTWSTIPTHVCVTLRVPRKKLAALTSGDATLTGTPALRCDIEGMNKNSRSWSNMFAAIQVAFGSSEVSQVKGSSRLHITEDVAGWLGRSDMFASFFVPTWLLLQPDQITPMVKCGILLTPQHARTFVGRLGIKLDLFEAKITSKHVIVSRYMPMMSHLPRLASNSSVSTNSEQRIPTGAFTSDFTTITNLTHRITYTTEAAKSTLADRSTLVQVHFVDAFRARVQVGKDIEDWIEFPIPMQDGQHKTRIARKSSYVEVEMPFWNALTEASKSFLFPTIPSRYSPSQLCVPAPWTATRINLDTLPVMQIDNQQKLQWLVPHTSMMFSTKERQIRESGINGTLPTGTKPNLRVEVKEGLFSIFMQYTGLQGTQAKVFGLSKDVGGINVLFLPSCCRLDLVNRTVVMDVAAIPLTNVMTKDPKVRLFYEGLASQGVMQIKVSHDELRCWKSCLPAFAERCRLWTHTANCEYLIKDEIPLLQGLEDGETSICSCGIGKFSQDYLSHLKLKNLQYVLKRYATRIAISPIFAVPYVEDCFLAGQSFPDSPRPAPTTPNGCNKCGSAKRKDEGGIESVLLVCAGCKDAKYCSRECQKADWKLHKQSCSKS